MLGCSFIYLGCWVYGPLSFILQMLGCSLNLFMMLGIWYPFSILQMLGCSLNLFMILSIWSFLFYYPNARVFLEFIYDVEYMVLFLLFSKCEGVPWIYLWCWVYGLLSFILQMVGSSLNLFMMLSIWSSILYFANGRVFL